MKIVTLPYQSAITEGNHTLQFLYGHDKQQRKTSFYNENGIAMEKYFVGLYEKETFPYNTTLSKWDWDFHEYNLSRSLDLVNMFSEAYEFSSLSEENSLAELIPITIEMSSSGNGRIYDPILGRMLSPDNYVQDPLFSQSYNRYSYVWNNPLRYTDPSGELIWVPIVAFTVVGAGSGAFVASRSGEDVLEGAIRGASLGLMAGLGVASMASIAVGGSAVAATATTKTVKGKAGFSAKKVAARIYGGLNNTLYNYDNDNSWGSSVGYFAAGFLGTHIGIESHVAYGMLLNGISNQAVALGDNKKDKDGYYFMQKFVGGSLNTFVSVSMYNPKITYMGLENEPFGKSLNYAIQNHASTFAYTDKDVYTKMGLEEFVGLTVAGLHSGFINYQITSKINLDHFNNWKDNAFNALGRSSLVLISNYYFDYGLNHQVVYGNKYGGFQNYEGRNIKKSSAGAKALNTALQLMLPE